MFKKARLNKKGFSLVELAIGLAVVTILILAISMSSGIRDNARTQAASDSVQAIRLAAESYLSAGQLNYQGMDVSVLKSNGMLPAGFVGTGANPWGGDYTIAPNTSDNTKFDIALTSVGQTAADKLTANFNNIANNVSYDASQKIWTGTF